MEKENTFMLKVLLIKEDGMKINKKAKVKRSGQMVHFITENTSEERNMEEVFFNGQMEQNLMETGKIIKCTDLVLLSGQMVEFTRVNTLMIRSMDRVSILGQIAGCIKEDSIMVNNTVRALIDRRVDKKFTVYGRKERRQKYVKPMKNFKLLKITYDFEFRQ